MIRPKFPECLGPCSVVALAVLLAATGVAAVAGQGKQAPQQPLTPTFRTQVNAVEVDAVVLDAQGRFVSDLRQEDFEVLEDGRPQPLVSVQVVNIPVGRVEVPLFANRPIPQDVETNARPFDGRLYLIVLDDLHTSPTRTMAAKRIARLFIQQNVAPNDLAAVVVTSGNRRDSQEFTSNRTLLLQAVNRFMGQKVISPALAAKGADGTADSGSADAAQPQRIFNARAMMETLTDLTVFSGTIRNRRKAIVLIGESFDYDLDSVSTTPRELRDRVRGFAAAAGRANVTLYAFDPRVYTQGGDDMVDVASGIPGEVTTSGEEIVKTVGIQNEIRSGQDNLRILAAETGGFAVVGSPSFAGAFDRIRVENSNYYMIGYSPTNNARDGKYRRIEVRVKRPGLKVEARKGYTAPRGNAPAPPPIDAKEGTSPAVRQALASTLPVSGFTLRAAAAPFKGSARNASVLVIVQMAGSELQFAPKGEKFEDAVELSVVAVDAIGKTRGGERQTVEMPLSADKKTLVTEAGLVFQMRVSVPPGLYQLRIAGRDSGSGRVGSVHYDLEVPDFAATPLAMSGLVLTADRAGQVPTPRPDETLKKLLPGAPIATREFLAQDTLRVLAEVYDNQTGPAHRVWIKTTVQAEDGRALFQQEDERASTELSGGRGGYGYLATVPLAELAPGLYVLRIEARSSLGTNTSTSRDLLFRVRQP